MKTINVFSRRTQIATAIAAAIGMSASLEVMSATDDEEIHGLSSFAAAILEEVQVYGTKRSSAQAAQDVPAQVSAYGSSQLQARQVVTIEDLSFATPNVKLGSVGTYPGVASFSIRGLGVTSSIPSLDPQVGAFVDGVYMGSTFGVITDTFDLESVEIYKGPQGVLFGRNVTGGAVLLRSARPDGEFGIKTKLGVETGTQYTAAVSVQGSLIDDVLAGKLSVYHKDDEGYFDNKTLGGKAGEGRTRTERGTLVYTPDDSTELTFIYEHGSVDGDSSVAADPANSSLIDHKGGFDTVQNNNGRAQTEWNQFTFEAGVDVGNGRVTNILAYRDLNFTAQSDIDATADELFSSDYLVDQYQWSNEIRYNISPTDSWDFVAGAFYFKQEFHNLGARYIFDGAVTVLGGGIQQHNTKAVFMNNDYALNETVTLNAGVRYTEEEKKVKVWALGECDYDVRDCPDREWSQEDWSNVSPKIGIQWQVAEDAQLYAHWTQGFRSGMYNFRTISAGQPTPTDVEEHNALEIGIKSNWLDGSLRLNAAVFSNEISDMVREVITTDPVVGVGQDFLNVADATITGIEVDVMYLLTDNLVINAAFGYLDGEYDKVNANLDRSDDNNNGLADDFTPGPEDAALDIPSLAKFTANFGIAYDMTIGDGNSLSSRVDYSYREESPYSDSNQAIFPAYEQVNAGFTYRPSEGDWSLVVYGKNLSNESVRGGLTSVFGNVYSPMKEGRRYGVEVNYEF